MWYALLISWTATDDERAPERDAWGSRHRARSAAPRFRASALAASWNGDDSTAGAIPRSPRQARRDHRAVASGIRSFVAPHGFRHRLRSGPLLSRRPRR